MLPALREDALYVKGSVRGLQSRVRGAGAGAAVG
jgi:hypothetical protein